MRTQRISPWKRGNVYWARVPQQTFTAVPRSLGTDDKGLAEEICTFLTWLKSRREWYALEQMGKGRMSVPLAFDAWRIGQYEVFVQSHRHQATDVDLEPWVKKWYAEMERIDKPTADTRPRYLKQVRALFVQGVPFPLSKFNKVTIREFLSQYGKVSNKYRAALSSFASYLKDNEVIASNPVLDVKAAKPSKPRDRYLSQDECKKLLDCMEGAPRAWYALMMATAFERQSMVRLLRRDVDLDAKTVFSRATKNSRRSRTCTIYWRWEWAWSIFTAYLKEQGLLPDAPVFSISTDVAYFGFCDAVKAAGLDGLVPHDLRHTWAVQGLRDGLTINTISSQLGHSNPSVSLNVYGKHIPTAADFAPKEASGVTPTQSPKLSEGGK